MDESLVRRLAVSATVLGGLSWVTAWVLHMVGVDPPRPLTLAGTALVLLGIAIAGTRLVKSGMVALGVVIGLAAALLAWVFLGVLRPLADPLIVDGIVGAVVAAAAVALYARRPGTDQGDDLPGGKHRG